MKILGMVESTIDLILEYLERNTVTRSFVCLPNTFEFLVIGLGVGIGVLIPNDVAVNNVHTDVADWRLGLREGDNHLERSCG